MVGVRGRREWEGAPRCCAGQANYASLINKSGRANRVCTQPERRHVRVRPCVQAGLLPGCAVHLTRPAALDGNGPATKQEMTRPLSWVEMTGQGKAARGEGPGRQREPSGDAESRLGGALTPWPTR